MLHNFMGLIKLTYIEFRSFNVQRFNLLFRIAAHHRLSVAFNQIDQIPDLRLRILLWLQLAIRNLIVVEAIGFAVSIKQND